MELKLELPDITIYMVPYGTYDGGREKAPAALCRKIINAKKNKEKKLKFGVMENKQEVFYILMIV